MERKTTIRGFSLLELLTTLAIISIVTTLALPLYSIYVMETRRMEAAVALSKLAIAMEDYHVRNNTYTRATLDDLHFPKLIGKNSYRMNIELTSESDYTLTAKPLGRQAKKDVNCGVLTLKSNGEKNVSGDGTVEECWLNMSL